MSTPSAPPATDAGQDLDAAHRAHVAATTPRTDGSTVDEVAFFGKLSFLVTIGYLSKDQAAALIAWVNSGGLTPPPPLPDPDGIIGPSVYEMLITAIHFGAPAEAADHTTHGFFGTLLSQVGQLVDTVIGGASDALASSPLGTAGSALIGFLSGLI